MTRRIYDIGINITVNDASTGEEVAYIDLSLKDSRTLLETETRIKKQVGDVALMLMGREDKLDEMKEAS